MIDTVRIGKMLQKAISQYNQQNYGAAETILNQALQINSNDFLIQFWFARTSFMLSNYKNAREHFFICSRLKPNAASILIDPWQKAIDQVIDHGLIENEIKALNLESDATLHNLHSNPPVRLMDIVKAVGIIGVIMLIGALMIFKWGSTYGTYQRFALFIMYTVAFVVYYYKRPILEQNLWIAYQNMIVDLQCFVQTKLFKRYCQGLFFITISMFSRVLTGTQLADIAKAALHDTAYALVFPYAVLYPISKLLLTPILSEILLRGLLFRFFRKYSVYGAYIITAGISFFNLIEGGDIFNSIMSLIYTYAYDKQRSLIAPILLHSLNGFTTVIWAILLKYVFM